MSIYFNCLFTEWALGTVWRETLKPAVNGCYTMCTSPFHYLCLLYISTSTMERAFSTAWRRPASVSGFSMASFLKTTDSWDDRANSSTSNIRCSGTHPKDLVSSARDRSKWQAFTRTACKAFEENHCQRLQDARDRRHQAASLLVPPTMDFQCWNAVDYVHLELAYTAIWNCTSDEMVTSTSSLSWSSQQTTNMSTFFLQYLNKLGGLKKKKRSSYRWMHYYHSKNLWHQEFFMLTVQDIFLLESQLWRGCTIQTS